MSVSTNLLSTSNSVDPKPFETSGISPCKLNRNQRTQVHNYDMPSGFQPSKLLSARHHPGCSWCQTSLLRWPHCTWHPRPKPPCPRTTQNTWGYWWLPVIAPKSQGPFMWENLGALHISGEKNNARLVLVWNHGWFDIKRQKKGTTLNSLGSSQNFVLCFGNRKKLKAMRFQRC